MSHRRQILVLKFHRLIGCINNSLKMSRKLKKL